MGQQFLEKVYEARDTKETRALYDEWSDSYDAEVAGQGYATPERCAAALARFSSEPSRPILDFGCGTGLSGEALRVAGFSVIDGADLSEEMLAQARDKGIYRDLERLPADKPANIEKGKYAAIAAVGVIGAGAAPVSVFDVMMYALDKGGLLVMSLNDHAVKDKANEGRICEWVDCGAARLLFCEKGPHLPGIDLQSQVYVLEKT
jgi:predicted TPR repeat methyltransferase